MGSEHQRPGLEAHSSFSRLQKMKFFVVFATLAGMIALGMAKPQPSPWFPEEIQPMVKECAKLSREKDVEKPTECCEAVPQAWLNNGFPQDCGEGMHCEMMASEEAPDMEMAVCMPDEEAAAE